MEKILNYINGELVEPISKNYLDNYNPSNGQVYSLIPDSEKADIEKAVEAAKEAFKIARELEDIAEEKGILLGEDHPHMPETVGTSLLNNGDFIIFFLQKKEQVEAYGEKLRKTAYYDVWKKDNPYDIDNPDNYNARHEQYKLKFGE